jgi:hypothetical protein
VCTQSHARVFASSVWGNKLYKTCPTSAQVSTLIVKTRGNNTARNKAIFYASRVPRAVLPQQPPVCLLPGILAIPPSIAETALLADWGAALRGSPATSFVCGALVGFQGATPTGSSRPQLLLTC